MKRKILVFHPDINVHKSFSYYTKSVYDILSENYEVKSFEWSLTHLFNKNIEVLFLFWFENLILIWYNRECGANGDRGRFSVAQNIV